jgi:hypothetical protein
VRRRRPDDLEQCLKRGAQIGDGLFWRSAIADRSDARAEQSGGTPDAILILLDYAGEVTDLSHAYSIARRGSSMHEHKSSAWRSGEKQRRKRVHDAGAPDGT